MPSRAFDASEQVQLKPLHEAFRLVFSISASAIVRGSGPRLRLIPANERPDRPKIGIGGRLAASPLPHHRAYGSVPRRFD